MMRSANRAAGTILGIALILAAPAMALGQTAPSSQSPADPNIVVTGDDFAQYRRTLKRDISQAEEEGLALVSDADAVEGEVKRMQGEIDQAEGVFAEFAQNVESEMKEAAAKLAELEARRRDRMNPDLPPEAFSLYERLLASREGVALAELDSRICQQCYTEVPVNLYVRVAKGDSVVQCPSCDRIFYVRM